MFGPLDAILTTEVLGVVLFKYLLVVLVLANMATRILAYKRNVNEADDEDATTASRHPLHAATTIALILTTFYYATYAPHGGVVLTMLVLGLFLTDFFEFETRAVDIRKDDHVRRPKGALVASLLVLAYATFQLVNEFALFVDTLSQIL
ncbi:hypothetical protein G9C85_11840 [Halorubellus sp. JP-L1]|nr:hypothetical protein [Halorubellus sp. JP-L1]